MSSARLGMACCLALLAFGTPADAVDLHLPSIFGDHMVLQREQPNRVWGWSEPGTEVQVAVSQQAHTTTADDEGRWEVTLDPMPVGGPFELIVSAGDTLRKFADVLIGEVWICSGQSNMAWAVGSSKDADLEIASAHYPQIRLISVPQISAQKPQKDFSGAWVKCSPATVRNFSAVGYFFGRQLHESLQVPIGLIDNAWGGSAAEAWVPRELMASDPLLSPLLNRWQREEQMDDAETNDQAWHANLDAWLESARTAHQKHERVPPPPKRPRGRLFAQRRPGNLYHGVLQPIVGYGIRGTIWYQGESNTDRAVQYGNLFPLMIQKWREDWKQGDFPFYWVQLADFRAEVSEPGDSEWAELREAQTRTMSRLPNTGQAVIIDLGEGRDIHPRNKQDVAQRLARWALARDYGMSVSYRSPLFHEAKVENGKMILTFEHVGSGLYAFDKNDPVGFAIAGADKKWVWASAKITAKNQVEVWNQAVTDPVAVRYAWSNNPVNNLQSREGLPVTPFRTDEWPLLTDGKLE